MKYQPAIVTAFFAEQGIPAPVYEFKFCETRRWRFDLCWPMHKVACEIQGGIWTGGRHSRGAALLKEWEKLNAAAVLGYRILFVQPKDLCTADFAETIAAALNV